MKKKKEAKALDLMLEQYDEFLVAQTKGLSIADYKCFIAFFTNKYNMDQFVVYLKLEKAGFDEHQINRYITELAAKIMLIFWRLKNSVFLFLNMQRTPQRLKAE